MGAYGIPGDPAGMRALAAYLRGQADFLGSAANAIAGPVGGMEFEGRPPRPSGSASLRSSPRSTPTSCNSTTSSADCCARRPRSRPPRRRPRGRNGSVRRPRLDEPGRPRRGDTDRPQSAADARRRLASTLLRPSSTGRPGGSREHPNRKCRRVSPATWSRRFRLSRSASGTSRPTSSTKRGCCGCAPPLPSSAPRLRTSSAA
jgi:hypothetical protein